MADYTLVTPFLNPDPAYAHGVEFGLLYSRMQTENEIRDYVTLSNQDQVLLTASRLGWRVIEIMPHDQCWFWLHMEKP